MFTLIFDAFGEGGLGLGEVFGEECLEDVAMFAGRLGDGFVIEDDADGEGLKERGS